MVPKPDFAHDFQVFDRFYVETRVRQQILLILGIQVCKVYIIYIYMAVSENSGTPKSSILIGFSIINHPFWGTTIFGNTHIYIYSDFITIDTRAPGPSGKR